MLPALALDPAASLAALRERGAHRFDPVRFRYLEAFARRLLQQQRVQRRLLERKWADALAAYEAQYDAARAELDLAFADLVQRHPQAAPYLNRLHTEGDVRAVRQLVARLDARKAGSGALARLLRHIDGQGTSDDAPVPHGGAKPVDAAPLAELKSVQRDRQTWTRLRVDEQLLRSQQQAPDNPGPLNSHLLVLRALRHMQELSPAYLDRFVAHVEALQWLDGAGVRKSAAASPRAKAARERGRRSAAARSDKRG